MSPTGGGAADETSLHGEGLAPTGAAAGSYEVRGVTRMLGRTLWGSDGSRLGEVSEVLVDLDRATAAYLLVATGGIRGVEEERRIVPWRTVGGHPRTGALLADIDGETFRNAPRADGPFTRQQGEEIHRFYGVAPYWQPPAPELSPGPGKKRTPH